jgi:very-short-patch-repair endonuclease
MTLAEARLWAGLRGRRLAGLRFRRQQIIDGFIVDFYCHAARLVIEVDGGIHRDQQGHDEARDRIFTSRGLRILRFTNDAVLERLDDVLTQIACTCTGTLADE